MTDPWSARRDGLTLAALVVIAVLLPLAVGAVAGSLDLPRNDDWSYRSIALHLFQTGRLEMDGAAETLLLGQIFAVQPLLWASGGAPWAFWVAGATFGAIAVVGAYLLARRLLSPQRAFLAAVLLPLFPGYLAYATSFMTDVPAAAMSFICLWMGMIALGRRPVSTRWLIGALLVGVFAFSIRQFTIAAPAAVVLAAVIAEPRQARHWAAAGVLVATCLAIASVRSGLAGQLGEPDPHGGAFLRVRGAITSISLVLLPAALVGGSLWRRHWRRGDVTIGAEIGLLLVGLWAFESLAFRPVQPLLDNLTSQRGVPSAVSLIGLRPILFPDLVWGLINALALVATVIVPAVAAGIIGSCFRRSRGSPRDLVATAGSPAGLLMLFCFATAGGLLLFGFRWALYDRYLWVLVPPAATLLMSVPVALRETEPDRAERAGLTMARTPAFPGSIAVAVSVAVIVGMSLTYLLNSHAFDVARWRAGEALVAEGVPASSVDAGYEWMGTYAPGLPIFAAHPVRETDLTWYSGLWPEFRLCALVSSSPVSVPGAELVTTDEAAYRSLLLGGPDLPLYTYRMLTPGCEPA